MKIQITEDSPILLKLIPETAADMIQNGGFERKLTKMKIPHKVKGDGSLLLNIDPSGWEDFTEHEEKNK